MANWSELLHDLLIHIAQQLMKHKDFVTFGAVCKSWCAAAKTEYFKGLRQHAPYLLFPVKDGNDDVREIYGLVEGDIVASVQVPSFKTKKCLESLGWMLTLEREGRISLLNPLTGIEIQVPHKTTFPEKEIDSAFEYCFLYKMVLSSKPSDNANFILMVICGGYKHLYFWRLGDKSWNRVDETRETGDTRRAGYVDVMYHDGHFYGVDYQGFVMDFNFRGENPTKGRIVTRLIHDVANNITDNTDGIF